jgi:ubiquinone biosynthesis protein COQ9
MRQRLLDAALGRAAQDGFTVQAMTLAAADAGLGCETVLRLFPDGPASLIAYYSERCDAQMVQLLTPRNLPGMKMRERIAEAVLARLEILGRDKEAARRAAAFLLLPANAALGTKLLYRTVDAMWHAAGDVSTDFSFYTKRGILAGVYAATLARWFNEPDESAPATRAFLSARIENVMQFEKFKAEVRERAKDLPSLSGVLAKFSPRRS